MERKEFAESVKFGIEGWLKKVVKEAAENEYRTMAAVWRMAVIDKYPELVKKYRDGKGGGEGVVDDLDLDFDLDDDLDFDDGLAGKTFDPADIDQADIDGEFEGFDGDGDGDSDEESK